MNDEVITELIDQTIMRVPPVKKMARKSTVQLPAIAGATTSFVMTHPRWQASS